MRSFASDNNSPVHPDIMQAVIDANLKDYVSYGADPYTEKAYSMMKGAFGDTSESFFVFTGTAANVLGISAAARPYNSVITAETSHMNVDECGALEKIAGCKLFTVPAKNGKISPDDIEHLIHGFGDEHHSQPKIISITQPTELGTVYSVEEIRELSRYARKNGMLLHMDGARLANAAASLGTGLGDITGAAGVDILSFGGTKNGMMTGESVVFFDPSLAGEFKYIRKQGMQLGAKMRYVSAQFIAYLEDGLWKSNASNANHAASLLKKEISGIEPIKLIQPVETNGLFVSMPADRIRPMIEKSFFYVWNEDRGEVRWMTSYDTSKEDVVEFASLIRESL